MLQQQFFSEKSKTNLSDFNTTIYLQKIENNKLISEKKIQQIIIKLYLNKIFKKISIINDFFKLINKFLIYIIIYFAQNY